MNSSPTPASSSWLPAALAGFTCFGLTNFILSLIAEEVGSGWIEVLQTIEKLALAMGGIGLIAWLGWRRSPRFHPFRNRAPLLFFPIVSGVTLIAGMTALKIGLATDPFSKGPVVALTSANALIVAILARFLLKDRLATSHIWGFSLVFLGVLVIAASYPSHSTQLAIVCGLLAMLGFGVTNFLLKVAAHRMIDPLGTVTILWISGGSVGLALSLARALKILPSSSFYSVWSEFGAFGAGFLLALGMLFLKIALLHGPAGPVTAVTGSNAVLVAVLDLLIRGHVPPPLKVLGMASVLAGILFMALSSLKRTGYMGSRARN